MPGEAVDRLYLKARNRLRYETFAANAWHLAKKTLSPLARLDLWVICRRDLTELLPPLCARIPIEVKLASQAELEQAAALDGGGEAQADWLRSWVRGGNMCFVAKVGSEVVARGLLGAGEMHFGAYAIVAEDDEVYLTGGYTARAWRGNRIHLELEYRRLLASREAGARAAYTMVSADNTRSLRNGIRNGYVSAGLMLSAVARPGGSPRIWCLRGSLHPVRLAGPTAMNHLLADNDIFAFEGCLLVIPRSEPRLYLLNPTARTIWEELARGLPPDAVAERLAARFEVPLAQVRHDIKAILAEWREHKLLARTPPREAALFPASAPADGAKHRSFHAERVYRLCGRPVRLRFEVPALEQAIHPPLAHTADSSSVADDSIDLVREGEGYLVVCNGSDVERAADEEEALGQVFGRLLELSYPEAAWLAVMHAAAVGDEHGAVILAGDSGSGKSTLTAALVHAGLRYFSDDVVPLDEALRIRPMPFGISVKEGSWPVLAARYPELEALPIHDGRRRRYLPIKEPCTASRAGLPVKSLVFPSYRPDQPTVLQPLTPLEVLERLTRARSWMSLDGGRFGVTLRWIEQTPGFEFSHASLDEAVLVVQGLLDGEGGTSRLQWPEHRGKQNGCPQG